jgi:hypothetical protein
MKAFSMFLMYVCLLSIQSLSQNCKIGLIFVCRSSFLNNSVLHLLADLSPISEVLVILNSELGTDSCLSSAQVPALTASVQVGDS